MRTRSKGFGRHMFVILLVCSLIVSGCEQREANEYATPEAAAQAMFYAFMRVRSAPDDAWAFLGPDTRARLELLAAEGPDHLQPIDYLRFGWLPDEALIQTVERLGQGGSKARLQMETEHGDVFEIEMIRADRGWQVELGDVVARPNTERLPSANDTQNEEMEPSLRDDEEFSP